MRGASARDKMSQLGKLELALLIQNHRSLVEVHMVLVLEKKSCFLIFPKKATGIFCSILNQILVRLRPRLVR